MKKIIYSIVSNMREGYGDLIYKVSWPTKQELSNNVVVVIIVSLVMALIVFVIDFSFESVVTFFYNTMK